MVTIEYRIGLSFIRQLQLHTKPAVIKKSSLAIQRSKAMSTLILPTGLAHDKVEFIQNFYAISDDQSKLDEVNTAYELEYE